MKYLLVDHPAPGVLRVRLDRPECRNAINPVLLEELEDAFRAPGESVLILGSSARRAFCAGGDLTLEPADLAALSDRLFAFYAQLIALPNVIVVAADGSAYGAGAQLLLCADLRVGGPDTRISFLGAKSGLALGTWRLPHLVGAGRAGELSLTGRPIGAAEALAAGLLDRVAEDADAEALSLATELSRAPDGVAGRVKTLLRGDDRSAERLERERLANSGHGVDRSVISR